MSCQQGKKLSPAEEQQLFEELLEKHKKTFSTGALGDFVEQQCQEFRERVALHDGKLSLTYHELLTLADQFAQNHLAGKQDLVIALPNGAPLYIATYAALRSGVRITYLNPRVSPHEVEFAADFEKSFVCVTNCSKIAVAVEGLGGVVVGPEESYLITLSGANEKVSQPFSSHGVVRFLTSGTTQSPKVVELSVRNLLTNAFQSYVRMRRMGLSQEQFLGALPLTHAFAHMTLLWLPLLSGSSVALLPEVSSLQMKRLFEQFDISVILGVPALLGLILSVVAPSRLRETLKVTICGGDRLSEQICDAWYLAYDKAIRPGYGLTEAGPVVSVSCNDEAEPLESAGEPLVGISVKRDDEGRIWISGDNVADSYRGKDGFACTYDLGELDGARLMITGRSDQLIVSNGFTLSPHEIEQVLLAHPAVEHVCVIGIDDANAGKIPVACFVLKKPLANCVSVLRKHCLEYLAEYKVPRRFLCFDSLPITQTGKVARGIVGNRVESM